MNINPAIMFWIGLFGTAAYAVAQGTISLTDAIPVAWIPFVVAWAKIDAFLVMTFMTAERGLHIGSPVGTAGLSGPVAKLTGMTAIIMIGMLILASPA